MRLAKGDTIAGRFAPLEYGRRPLLGGIVAAGIVMLVIGCGRSSPTGEAWAQGGTDAGETTGTTSMDASVRLDGGPEEDLVGDAESKTNQERIDRREILRKHAWLHLEQSDRGSERRWYQFRTDQRLEYTSKGRFVSEGAFFHRSRGEYEISSDRVVDWTIETRHHDLHRHLGLALVRCDRGLVSGCRDDQGNEGTSPDWVWPKRAFVATSRRGRAFVQHAVAYAQRAEGDEEHEWRDVEGARQTMEFEYPLTSDRPCRMTLTIEAGYQQGDEGGELEETFDFNCRVESIEGGRAQLIVSEVVEAGPEANRPWSTFIEVRGLDDRYNGELLDVLEYHTFAGRFRFDPKVEPLVLVPEGTDADDLAFVSVSEEEVPTRGGE